MSFINLNSNQVHESKPRFQFSTSTTSTHSHHVSMFPLSDSDLKIWTSRARRGGIAIGLANCDQFEFLIACLKRKDCEFP